MGRIDVKVSQGGLWDPSRPRLLGRVSIPRDVGWSRRDRPWGKIEGRWAGYRDDPEDDVTVEMTDSKQLGLEQVRSISADLAATMNGVIEGKAGVVHTVITALLAQGHVLVEDVPGVGKTLIAKTLARAIDCPVRRIQFTPDVLPSDVSGVSIFNQDTRRFEFRPGAIPKTQSALLEAMEEGQVTIDGETYPLPQPFMVVATQNPIEMEGTHPLAEAQRDRFIVRVAVGYPSASSELAMLDGHSGRSPVEDVRPVTDARTVMAMIAAVQGVYAAPALKQYIVDVAHATRTSSAVRLGASPRAAIHLLRAARAHAALAGRDHVLPDDVQAVAVPVLAHRLILTGESHAAHRTGADIITDLLARVTVTSGSA